MKNFQRLADQGIQSAEWQDRQKRERFLKLVIDGEDAEAVLKYAEKLKRETEQELLASLRRLPPDGAERDIYYYKAVCELCDMLAHAAEVGKRRAADLAK